jgi:hypothetical protein
LPKILARLCGRARFTEKAGRIVRTGGGGPSGLRHACRRVGAKSMQAADRLQEGEAKAAEEWRLWSDQPELL